MAGRPAKRVVADPAEGAGSKQTICGGKANIFNTIAISDGISMGGEDSIFLDPDLGRAI